MPKILITLLLVFIGITLHSELFAQTNKEFEIPNVLHPSPTASELGRFALIGNSLSTGNANSHIELYNFKTRNLSVPVGLDYSANGLKVDMLSSRVGMNWMLSAGGLISRVVYGAPDELNVFSDIPRDFPETRGSNLLEFVNSVKNGLDTQPDVFTFNFDGHSGRFIIINNTIQKMEQNNLKITGDYSEGFIITTPDGVKYTFNAQEVSLSISAANPFNKDRVTNAWFLSQIKHPKGDVISFSYARCEFTYLASKSNSYIYYESTGGGCIGCNKNISTQEISTQLRNFGVYLRGIVSNFKSAGWLKFNYLPRTDVNGDFYLSSITFGEADNQPIKTTSFQYISTTDRFFLEKLIHGDQNYVFDYYNLSSLPARFSYAQDHNGYYNGKTGNSSLIPKPKDQRLITAFSSRGFGDRRTDPNFSKYGMLKKITYPTGGSDSLVYEGHGVYTSDTLDCEDPISESNIVVSGSSEFKQQQIFYSNKFRVSCIQDIFINLGCNVNSHAADGRPTYPLGEYLATAQIINHTTGEIEDVGMTAGADQHKTNGELYLIPGDYSVRLKVRGDAGGSVSFKISNNGRTNGIREIPGLRLKEVVSYDPIAKNTRVKKYYYADLKTNVSSGETYNPMPSYDSRFDIYQHCQDATSPTDPFFSVQACKYTRLSSTPNFGLSNVSGNHIYYSQVIEGYGENFENGGVEHKYKIYMDGYPAMIAGYLIFGGPVSSSGLNNQALEISKKTFKKVNEKFIPISEVITNYLDDSRLSERRTFFAMSVEPTAHVANSIIPSNPSLYDLRGVNVNQYDIVSRWVYPDTVKTILYNNDGTNPVVSTKVFKHNNLSHQLVNVEETYNSNGTVSKTEYSYPQDNILGLTTVAEMAKQQLIVDHNLSPILEQTEYLGIHLTGRKRTNFKIWTSSLIAPESVELFNEKLDLEQKFNFYNYDSVGNVLSQGFTNGPSNSYIWSYGGLYPVAEITNIRYSTLQSALGTIQIESLLNHLNPDKDIIDNFLTPLKTPFPNALVKSFVYKPAIGVISSTDQKGLTTYYEYDDFLRLKFIKDQNKNIIKSYDYRYKL